MKKITACIAITAALSGVICSTAFAGRPLSVGYSGDDVYRLQQLLAAYGYFYEDPSGYFGELTENAVINFQYDFGLEADGVVGTITSSYLGLATDDYGYDDYDDGYDDYNDYAGYEDSFTYTSLSRTLYNGMSGDDVSTLQALLADYGYYYGELTGYFGEITENAVINFQYDYGLEADGIAGADTIGMLTGTYTGGSYEEDNSVSYYDYAAAVLDAVYRTPATGSGYCAAWVTNVMENAGILTYNINSLRPTYYSYASTSGLADGWYSGSTGFNANDYWAYVCYSSDPADLQPGMVVATRSSYTYLGRQFGHVGIYLGDGQVISSIGYLETLSLEEWERRYNNTEYGSTIAWGYLPY